MKIGRLTSRVEVAGKDGKAGLEFSRLWDQVCSAIEAIGTRGSGYAAMTGASDDATVYDTTTITTAQLAARVKALEDRIASVSP